MSSTLTETGGSVGSGTTGPPLGAVAHFTVGGACGEG